MWVWVIFNRKEQQRKPNKPFARDKTTILPERNLWVVNSRHPTV